ncbi:MAG: hypothetical protein M1825_001169 [Sarcosagium campestre]|nr:MAG: hypothetical protein M1825_001169 [Sarcosagium campestre]
MPFRINIPPLTRILLVVLLGFSILSTAIRYTPGSDKSVPYLTIVPQLSLFYPWVLLTATFVELNVFTLSIAAATIFYGGKYLERAWSSAEFAKFVLIVCVIPNLLTWTTFLIFYAILPGSDFHTYESVCGGFALQAAFLVAFKQLVPEHTVTIAKGVFKIRVKHFPALFVLCNVISGVIFGTETAALLSVLGFLTSWVYLRFYKNSSPDLSTSQPASLRGDASETFAFAYFFPDPLHGPVAIASDAIYNVLVSVGVCTPFSAADIDAGNSQAAARGEGGLPSLLGRGSGGGPAPGSARAEAERRRALALKALDQRLHAATNKFQGTTQESTSGPAARSNDGEQPPREQDDVQGKSENQA